MPRPSAAPRRAAHVINDILDFSKIEAGKMVIESFPFDLRQTMEEVARCWRRTAEEKRVDLGVQYPARVPCRLLAMRPNPADRHQSCRQCGEVHSGWQRSHHRGL